jgi:hypothetical protein
MIFYHLSNVELFFPNTFAERKLSKKTKKKRINYGIDGAKFEVKVFDGYAD